MSPSAGRIIAFTAMIFVLTVGIFYLSQTPGDPLVLPVLPEGSYLPVISVGGSPVSVMVADTEAERVKGLSGRKPLGPREGMLFVFEKDGIYGFWMKNMNFAIDIIWIDAQGTVVDIKQGATPESYPDVFTPHTPARYVLEVTADFTDIRNIHIGDKVDLSAVGR